jgi:predicted MFS family arabinose efflux permease
MRRVLPVLFAVNLLNIYDRTILSPALEPIRRDFHVSDMQLGLLSTAFIVIYALAGVPLGALCDRGSRRLLLAGGLLVWSGCTAAGALATGYAGLLASRLGVGIGEAVCAPAATSWLGDVAPANRRARALAIFMLAVPIGTLFSFGVNGPLAQSYGWRTALAAAGLPALVLAPALLLLREPVRSAPPATQASGWGLLKMPAFRWIVASGALLNFNLYTLASFVPAFLTRRHGWSVAEAGVWTGVGMGAAGLLGGLAVAAFGDRWSKGGGGRLLAAAVLTLAAAPLSLAGVLAPRGLALGAVLLMASYGLLNMYYGLVYASIQDLVAPHQRAIAMSLYFLAMYLCGGAFGPMLTGRLSDALARRAMAGGLEAEAARAAGLHSAMLVIPAFSLVLALVLWAGSRAMPQPPREHGRPL